MLQANLPAILDYAQARIVRIAMYRGAHSLNPGKIGKTSVNSRAANCLAILKYYASVLDKEKSFA